MWQKLKKKRKKWTNNKKNEKNIKIIIKKTLFGDINESVSRFIYNYIVNL